MLKSRGGRPAGPRAQASAGMLDHWKRSVHLITAVQEEDGFIRVGLPTRANREAFLRRVSGDSTVQLRGRTLRVIRWEQDAVLLAPAEGAQAECGEDHIVAVNLTRPLDKPPDVRKVRDAIARAVRISKGAAQVTVTHYLGGPCSEDSLVSCIVPGGTDGPGWTCVQDLEDAVLLAHRRAVVHGDICAGQTVRLSGSSASSSSSTPALGGELGLALEFEEGRWLVRTGSGEVVRVSPAALIPGEGAGGRVLAFWGDARWSRVQLLGEIARGHWGLCRAGVMDIIVSPARRWPSLDGRLAFAPVTEMTESSLEEARQQMTTYRATGLAQPQQPAPAHQTQVLEAD